MSLSSRATGAGFDDRHEASLQPNDAILLDQISKTYEGDIPVPVLRPCSARMRSGDLITIAGPSGSGKSTLLNILGLLDEPTEGRYLFRGQDVGQLTEGERNLVRGASLGFIFQSFHLLSHYTSVENVLLGTTYGPRKPRRIRIAAAERALQRVGLAHRKDAFPSTLSGGESQRVAIARAIVRDPPVILCDEPTGNLDSVASSVILGILSGLSAQGICVVIVTHDPIVTAIASRRFSIRDGLLSET